MKLTVTLLLGAGLASAQPVVNAWIRTPSGNPAVRPVAPEVHDVRVESDEVYVESAGLTLHSLAPWGAGDTVPAGPQIFHFRFPLHPTPAVRVASASQGTIGAFLTGVPIFSPASGPSWQDANMWHLDLMSRAPSRPDLFTRRAANPQIIGFALDGYPVYAGGGEQSAYRLRTISARRTLPDGTLLTPGQDGPPVSTAYPLGTFLEDYEYAPGEGTLDRHNGRDTESGYGYYATATYPYLIGAEFYGRVEAPTICSGMQMATVEARAGAPVELSLCTASGRLERVHEKLIHLIVVSEDLRDFAHLHPEQQASAQRWKTVHTFPREGLYRLYAEYTPAGEERRIARFTLRVQPGVSAQAPPRGAAWVSLKHAPLRAGEDVLFEFPVNEPLEPYLGAWGHFIVVSEDGREFLHGHPAEEMPAQDPWQHSHLAGASPNRVTTMIGFPRAGRYRIWAQFQKAGVVTTNAWNLDVTAQETAAGPGANPVNAIHIQVSAGGYQPARIPVPKDKPVRLAFTRADAANCGGTVVFPDLGIRRELPAGRTTIVELPATGRDEIRFGCGMGMLKGALVVVP